MLRLTRSGVQKLSQRALAFLLWLLVAALHAWSQARIQAVTDQSSYNVGSTVRLEIIFPNSSAPRPVSDLSVRLRYAGESRPLLNQLPLSASFIPSGAERTTGYHELWKIPSNARTGRYEIDLVARDPKSREVTSDLPRAAAFVVHRKLVRIERVELDKPFYTSGDPIACRVALRNLSGQPLKGLQVEFSERYWPWIAQSSERAGVDVFPVVKALSLRPLAQVEVRSSRAGRAKQVEQPTAQQFAVVVWDHERKNVYDIAFSPLVFIRPPGVDRPMPYAAPPGYPLQYLYPDLAAVNVSSYRHFYPPDLDSAAIQFERSHTMFASGSTAEVNFSITNPTPHPWRGATVRVQWLDPDGKELGSEAVAQGVELDPGGPALKKIKQFTFPASASGIYRTEVRVEGSQGEILAASSMEIGVNALPKSILIFCAHEDDEGAHAGIIRAAVENHVPLHLVYFTSGDAGSCDRYYQHSCGPTEALNFGELRMEEARASLGHLGVPREDIYFLGLPDGGSGQIWSNHPQPSNPYLAVLLATDHAPYEGLAQPNLPYARDAAVEMAKEFIKKFQPEVIYTGHPDERHVDHRTNNWFVVKALQELVREGGLPSTPTLLVDQVYGPAPQTRAPYRYQKHVLNVSGEAMALAQEAGWFYQSQAGNREEANLRPFDRLRRTEIHWQVLDWKDHEAWNERH